MSENAWIEQTARDLLAKEYDDPATGHEGPYPTYAGLARSGYGAFTLCSIRAVMRGIELGMSRAASPPLGMSGGMPAGEAVSHNPMADRELNWLVHQLEAWPTRVDPDRTTNIQYLMQASAKHIRATPINTPTPPIEGRDVERVREALTPSGGTKAAYHGEFTFDLCVGISDAGIEQYQKVYVPWDTVKEIMAAIRTRAAIQALGERG